MNYDAMHHWTLDFELDQMSKYLDTMSSFLNSSEKELSDFVEKQASELDEEFRHDYYESYQVDFAELHEDFPRLLLNGFIVTWYSFVEQQLIDLCARRKLTIAVSIRDRDRLEDGIRRAHKFLREAAGYQIDNGTWQELLFINWLRNHIVHNGEEWVPRSLKEPSDKSKFTEVKEKDPLTMEEHTVYVKVDQNCYAYLRKHSLVSDSFQLTPSDVYCRHLVLFGKTFFKKIYKDLGLM